MLDDLYELYDPADVANVLSHLVMPYLDRAAILTAEWYESLAPELNHRVSDDQRSVTEGRINYTAQWALRQSGVATPADRTIGTFQRMVFDASRGVVIDNAKAEGAAWHRDALPDACSFCRLLTVDPSAYQGKYVDMPSHNHDCRCLAVVSRGDNIYAPPEYVNSWQDEVRRNRSGDLTETLASMGSSNV